jgi:menaquinol-cytochrome c reductase iron-sulfur subunit
MTKQRPSPTQHRRDFVKKAAAVVVGGAAAAVPVIPGLAVLMDPLRHKGGGGGEPVLVTTLASVPEDGTPRKFPVLATHVDAWNRSTNVPVGSVYLRRVGEKLHALNVSCPHAGCFVDYLHDQRSFLCPCHNSHFALNGSVNDPRSPSPRALDELEVELRNGTEVWVKFQNFRAGEKEKVAV